MKDFSYKILGNEESVKVLYLDKNEIEFLNINLKEQIN